MKTGFTAIVVLSLTAHTLANGDGSTGAKCVYKCYKNDFAEVNGRSSFQQMFNRASAPEDRECS
ncbi:hypothetical protein AAVH_35913 [Aphelenchoides avenae]|nr:hypothetical protein AAVH_35913 [Aphelenchus avenae]